MRPARKLVDDRVLQRPLNLRDLRSHDILGDHHGRRPSGKGLQERVHADATGTGHQGVRAHHVGAIKRWHVAPGVGVEVEVIQVGPAHQGVAKLVSGQDQTGIGGQHDRGVGDEDLLPAPGAGGAAIIWTGGAVGRIEMDDRAVAGGRYAVLDHDVVQVAQPGAVGVAAR